MQQPSMLPEKEKNHELYGKSLVFYNTRSQMITFMVRKPLLSVSIMLNRDCTSSSLISCLSIFSTCFQPATEISLNRFCGRRKNIKIYFKFHLHREFIKINGLVPIAVQIIEDSINILIRNIISN